MRLTRGIAALAVLFSSATLATCVFPTERDSSVHVSVTRMRILIRGRDTTAKATAWQMVAPADSQRIPNVSFVWSSSNPAVATVDNAGHIVGVNSGAVVIRGGAANFDKASATGDDTLRVSAPLEIDSVRPKTVKYGEKLTIWGVGADSIFSASLAGAQLIRVPFSDTAFKSGTARTRFWVPPPATTDSLFYLGISGGLGVFGFLHGDTTRVLERDIYEPNDTIPSAIDLDAARPFPTTNTLLDSLLFFNPALAFETLKDRKSTRLNSSHLVISYAVFCLKKKTIDTRRLSLPSPARQPCLLSKLQTCPFLFEARACTYLPSFSHAHSGLALVKPLARTCPV